ncbi:hypothetical protein N0V88_000290 [Collariella sp. IMI 366227]|nr:hypothetical protein N0V88_000290 [Collariella sp. IMI 366227]
MTIFAATRSSIHSPIEIAARSIELIEPHHKPATPAPDLDPANRPQHGLNNSLHPRFLLPQSGLIWRQAAVPPTSASIPAAGRLFLRYASSKPPPAQGRSRSRSASTPSHGSRLPKKTIPRHYGGDLSATETAAQAQREYPGTPPPKDTRAHWFIHNRWIHVVITVGTLTTLSIYTFALNFTHTSPSPTCSPASDYLSHPIASTRMLIEVLKLHEAHKTAAINESAVVKEAKQKWLGIF